MTNEFGQVVCQCGTTNHELRVRCRTCQKDLGAAPNEGAQVHFAQLACERYDKITDLERDAIDNRRHIAVLTAERDVWKAKAEALASWMATLPDGIEIRYCNPVDGEPVPLTTVPLNKPPESFAILAGLRERERRAGKIEAYKDVGCTCAISPKNPLFREHFKWCPIVKAAELEAQG